jgi:rhodanese-related sulfurtransferase
MRRVRADEAMKLAKSGEALIIDVRGTDSYNTQHIKGALDFSLSRIEQGDFKGLPHNKLIIAYCA